MKKQDLIHDPIPELIKKIAIPSSTGLMFNTFYNVVDTYFAGQQLGTAALSGLTVAFPIYFIVSAIARGLGNGETALSSISLGQKDKEKSHSYLLNSLLLCLIFGPLLAFCTPFVKPLLSMSGATGKSLQAGYDYLFVIFYSAIFFCLNAVLNGYLVSQGDTTSYRNFLILGFFLNVILDPLFIIGFGPIPGMGVAGVAISTGLIQAIGSLYLAHRVLKSPEFDWEMFKKSSLHVQEIKDLLQQGIPATLNTATTALGVFVINFFIIKMAPGPNTIAAYGVAMRVEQLALVPTMGLNSVAISVSGQSYGAKNIARVEEVRNKTITYGCVFIVIGGMIIYPFTSFLIGLFTEDVAVIQAGTQYLHIELFAFPTYIILSLLLSVLQGVKKPAIAVYISIYRQIIMPFIVFTLLGKLLGITGVYIGIVLVNWSAVLIAALYSKVIFTKLRKSEMLGQ